MSQTFICRFPPLWVYNTDNVFNMTLWYIYTSLYLSLETLGQEDQLLRKVMVMIMLLILDVGWLLLIALFRKGKSTRISFVKCFCDYLSWPELLHMHFIILSQSWFGFLYIYIDFYRRLVNWICSGYIFIQWLTADRFICNKRMVIYTILVFLLSVILLHWFLYWIGEFSLTVCRVYQSNKNMVIHTVLLLYSLCVQDRMARKLMFQYHMYAHG